MTDRYWLDCTRSVYDIIDRLRQPQEIVARVDDPVDGERLVRLLNEDERRKAHTAFLRGFANEIAKEYRSAGK